MANEDFPKVAVKVLMLFIYYEHHNSVKIRLEVLI